MQVSFHSRGANYREKRMRESKRGRDAATERAKDENRLELLRRKTAEKGRTGGHGRRGGESHDDGRRDTHTKKKKKREVTNWYHFPLFSYIRSILKMWEWNKIWQKICLEAQQIQSAWCHRHCNLARTGVFGSDIVEKSMVVRIRQATLANQTKVL